MSDHFTGRRELTIRREVFPISGKFTISRGAKTEAQVITVEIAGGGALGRGECVPYARYGETLDSVEAAIEKIRTPLQNGLSRQALQAVMSAGAARNAVDCALWDLEAKLSGVPVAKASGLAPLSAETTAYTISLDTPEKMAQKAAESAAYPLLKIKLGGQGGDIERMQAVREAAPSSALIADANEGWTESTMDQNLFACEKFGFELIEQPLPAEKDDYLRGLPRSTLFGADESVHDRKSLRNLLGKYDCVNIKLDKTGGLTEAIAMVNEARGLGFEVMIGCMVGSSLAMAPALLLAPLARYVDLDGPLLLSKDREPGLKYEGPLVSPPEPELWG